jgi:hypothetical protein
MLGIGDSVFASCCIELSGFAAKIPQTVETTVKNRVLSRHTLRSTRCIRSIEFKSF